VLEPIQIDTSPAHMTISEATGSSLSGNYPGEVRRWVLLAGIPMLGACVCIALAIGTPLSWFYGGVVLFGPGMGVAAIIYLSITTDTNGQPAPQTTRAPRLTQAAEKPPAQQQQQQTLA
jgi:hypothetical protein